MGSPSQAVAADSAWAAGGDVGGARRGARRLRCLVVGASPDLERTLRRWTEESGADFDTADEVRAACRRMAGRHWDLVLFALPDEADVDPSRWSDLVAGSVHRPHVVLAVRRPSLDLAFRAQSSGILDVLALPPRRQEFVRALDRVRSERCDSAVALPRGEGDRPRASGLVGESGAMCALYRQIALVAACDATVTLQGESGTGKELVARSIHDNGARRDRPFVAFNCAAIPQELLESELFGHERGAFTGAIARRLGRFQRAHGGTLFLDEVADMSLHLQAKILRAVEEREVEPVGGGVPVPIDIRVIAATNHDLAEEVARGRFRKDLYHRITVVKITVPPLSERGDDIDLLAGHFARLFAQRNGKCVSAISERALSLLRAHAWEGNVRELRNVIERAVVVCMDDTIRTDDLPLELRTDVTVARDAGDPAPLTLAQAEARHIDAILSRTDGQIQAAASILGIHRNTLARKLRRSRAIHGRSLPGRVRAG